MNFRRRVRVFPGFTLNFSASGVSATAGFKGASINFSKRGAYLNTSIPGTGLYDRQKIFLGSGDIPGTEKSALTDYTQFFDTPISPEIKGEIKSADTSELSSSTFADLKDALLEAHIERQELPVEISKAKNAVKKAKNIKLLSKIFIFGFFAKSFDDKVEEKVFEMECLEDQLNSAFIDIDVHFDITLKEKYTRVISAFNDLTTSERIVDVTAAVSVDRFATRSAASREVTTESVKFTYNNIDIIKSSYSAFHFENKNGDDLYIYPAFVILVSSNKEFAIIDIKDFNLDFGDRLVLTSEPIPLDTEIVDKRWAKENKDGSRDKRFTGNYQIPVVKYGGLYLQTATGLNEEYMVSNYKYAMEFERAFSDYKEAILT